MPHLEELLLQDIAYETTRHTFETCFVIVKENLPAGQRERRAECHFAGRQMVLAGLEELRERKFGVEERCTNFMLHELKRAEEVLL